MFIIHVLGIKIEKKHILACKRTPKDTKVCVFIIKWVEPIIMGS